MKSIVSLLVLAAFIHTPVVAQPGGQTGTRVDSHTARPMVLQLNESSVLDEIQRLINEGDTAGAVELARRNLASFDHTVRVNPDENLPARYFALNALCVALTRHGEPDEAAEACTEAIGLLPQRWSAINNRGTARYTAGRFGEALSDYRLALRVAPREPNITATIEHNINLTIARQAAERQAP
jgi:tetratricopeptide (TPR) repeat protein